MLIVNNSNLKIEKAELKDATRITVIQINAFKVAYASFLRIQVLA
jgi:hypothetical protein